MGIDKNLKNFLSVELDLFFTDNLFQLINPFFQPGQILIRFNFKAGMAVLEKLLNYLITNRIPNLPMLVVQYFQDWSIEDCSDFLEVDIVADEIIIELRT